MYYAQDKYPPPSNTHIYNIAMTGDAGIVIEQPSVNIPSSLCECRTAGLVQSALVERYHCFAFPDSDRHVNLHV